MAVLSFLLFSSPIFSALFFLHILLSFFHQAYSNMSGAAFHHIDKTHSLGFKYVSPDKVLQDATPLRETKIGLWV